MERTWKVVNGPVVIEETDEVARNVSDGVTARSEVWDWGKRAWVPGASVGAVLGGIAVDPQDAAALGP